MDASYGTNSALGEVITGFGLSCVAAIVATVKVRPVRKGDPKLRRLSVEALALKLPPARLAHHHLAQRPERPRSVTGEGRSGRRPVAVYIDDSRSSAQHSRQTATNFGFTRKRSRSVNGTQGGSGPTGAK
jgi:hypothetical protein